MKRVLVGMLIGMSVAAAARNSGHKAVKCGRKKLRRKLEEWEVI